jgi:hypothetical protein
VDADVACATQRPISPWRVTRPALRRCPVAAEAASAPTPRRTPPLTWLHIHAWSATLPCGTETGVLPPAWPFGGVLAGHDAAVVSELPRAIRRNVWLIAAQRISSSETSESRARRRWAVNPSSGWLARAAAQAKTYLIDVNRKR